MSIDGEELTAYVVDALSQGRSEADVVLALCRRYDLRWSEARAAVDRVCAYRSPLIARKQVWLFTLISVGFIVGGLALIGSLAARLVNSISSLTEFSAAPITLDFAGRLMLAVADVQSLGLLVVGGSMVVGGVVGIWRAWKDAASS